MTDKPIDVSIIIPVYNTEKYLAMCLESVTAQEGNIEIILINDGSNDRSPEICREFNKKDNRIIVIDQQNSGVSTARNKGIECARGKYIMFVDSDDTIDKCMINELMVLAKNNDFPDLIYSGFYRHSNSGVFNSCIMENAGLYYKDKMHKIISLMDPLFLGAPWCKLYKRTIISDNNIIFNPNIQLQEDLIFNYDFLEHTESIYITDKAYYHYNVNEGGSGRFRGEGFIKNKLEVIKKEDSFWAKIDISSKKGELINHRAYDTLFAIYTIYRRENLPTNERIEWMKKYIQFADNNIPNWLEYINGGVPGIFSKLAKRKLYRTADLFLWTLFRINRLYNKKATVINSKDQ